VDFSVQLTTGDGMLSSGALGLQNLVKMINPRTANDVCVLLVDDFIALDVGFSFNFH
jgi:hypothetical protein